MAGKVRKWTEEERKGSRADVFIDGRSGTRRDGDRSELRWDKTAMDVMPAEEAGSLRFLLRIGAKAMSWTRARKRSMNIKCRGGFLKRELLRSRPWTALARRHHHYPYLNISN